jgi:hypothetical protein
VWCSSLARTELIPAVHGGFLDKEVDRANLGRYSILELSIAADWLEERGKKTDALRGYLHLRDYSLMGYKLKRIPAETKLDRVHPSDLGANYAKGEGA